MKRDQYGFSMANFNRLDGRVHADSFAFPLHVQQVFFSDDPGRQGWKIVCRTDVRGRRGQLEVHQPIPSVIDVDRDSNFVGLQPQMLDLDPVRQAAADGGVFVSVAREDNREEEEASELEEEA